MDRTNFSDQSPPQAGANVISGKDTALQSFFAFPFTSDEVYQQGLADVLAHGALSGKTDAEKAETILRTQLFYFNRVAGQNLTVEDVRSHQNTVDSQNPIGALDLSPPSANPGDSEARLLTFAELTLLIQQGKTDNIPNNKVIPETLNDAPPSTSIALVRKKPWESDS
ncbi:hypothetical protein CY34DRAFT_603956 [Suillus luteus UH-Slu-Lm8-n1]|uniref:Uncharacterized protein n=1 Tax=Suillus luteus UH-Slu-Lm8-n1 TaxID=930992 RepID=A0A0D0BF37_9AGAM|nr:hypothetical protein CY34DRAFT_603956 [Suillus luteus UH-Slu-Lm8-n1]